MDSALKKDENYYPQVFLKECKYIKQKVIRYINSKRAGSGAGGGQFDPLLERETEGQRDREREGETCFFLTFNIIICHIFPEHFFEVCQVVQKI